jgi:hypothetical protein
MTLLCLALLAGCRPQPTPTATPLPPTPTAAPATPAPQPTLDAVGILCYLPPGAQVLDVTSADLDGDGQPEYVALAGWAGAAHSLGYDRLELFVIEPDRVQLPIVWRSDKLAGERAQALRVKDANGDGRLEVLSEQAMGAAGDTLYVLAWRGEAYDWLRPHGGHFDGLERFGEVGVNLEDISGDGLPEILADYGAASLSTDVYRWDGTQYAFGITLSGK